MNSEAKNLSDAGANTVGHTPGPWVDDEFGHGWIDDANGNAVVEYAGCGSHQATWPNPADKTLAKAAPDLLAACKGLMRCIPEDTEFAERRFDDARAAIARAEGR